LCKLPHAPAGGTRWRPFGIHGPPHRAPPATGNEAQPERGAEGDLVAWRRPGPAFEQRNFALALANLGMERRSPPQIVRGYRLLTEVQKSFPDDIDVLNGLGMTFSSVRSRLKR